MKIGVVSGWDNDLQPLADLTWPNKQEYCKLRGYTADRVKLDRGGYWSKMLALTDLMPMYDLILLADLDALVMDFTRTIESVIGGVSKETDLIFTHDANGINMGISFWRCTDWSYRFARKMIEPPGTMRFPHEQPAVAQHLYSEPKDKWHCAPQRAFNSYRYELYPQVRRPFPDGQYQPGDFIFHVPGLPLDQKIAVLKEMLPQVKRG